MKILIGIIRAFVWITLIFLLLAFITFGPCRPKEEEFIPIRPTEEAVAMSWDHIVDEYQKIAVGMTALEVQEIVGRPHEVAPLYKPVIRIGGGHRGKIGTKWSYYKEPQREDDIERRTYEFRVDFDLQGKVMSVVATGLEP